MIEGKFRKKKGYTACPNTVVYDERIDAVTLALYTVIQSRITYTEKVFTKKDLEKWVVTNTHKFTKNGLDKSWNKLKECGYLKVYKYSTGKGTRREYELLDAPSDTPIETWITKSNQNDSCEVEEGSYEGTQELPQQTRAPRNKTVDEGEPSVENPTPENPTPGNPIPRISTPGNLEVGNLTPGKQHPFLNNINNNNHPIISSNNKDFCFNAEDFSNNLLHHPNNDVSTKYDEEDIKKQIEFEVIDNEFPGNTDLLKYIVSQMLELLNESKPNVLLSKNHYENIEAVRTTILQIVPDDIRRLLNVLPAKSEDNIRSPKNYMREALFNIPSQREAICSTVSIQKNSKEPNNGNYDFQQLENEIKSSKSGKPQSKNKFNQFTQSNYDWDEINRELGIKA